MAIDYTRRIYLFNIHIQLEKLLIRSILAGTVVVRVIRSLVIVVGDIPSMYTVVPDTYLLVPTGTMVLQLIL